MVSEVNGPGVGAVSPLEQRSTKIDKAASVAASAATNAKAADVVTLTDLASRLQKLTDSIADLPVSDQQRVETFRQSIADGSYKIDSPAVAEKLAAMESLLAELSSGE